MVCYSNNRPVAKEAENGENDLQVEVRFRRPIHIPTRPPNDGRFRDGGLRVGEMEHDPIFQQGNAVYQRILH
jgi:hypothetical protein